MTDKYQEIVDVLVAAKNGMHHNGPNGREEMLARAVYQWYEKDQAAGTLSTVTDGHAAVLGMANQILERDNGRISTHAEECWMWHLSCFAKAVKDLLEPQ